MTKLLQVQNAMLLSFVLATAIMVVGLVTFMVFEPAVSQAASSTSFQVSQSITGEISIKTPVNNVTMSPALAGITGGNATGSTQVVVTTNNPTGYTMTMYFASTTAMNRNGGGGYINNYTETMPGTPDFAFNTSRAYGQFSYTVDASNTSDLAAKFLDDGSTCGFGASDTVNACWASPSTTATASTTIISTLAATPTSGSTSTIQFRVNVPSNPSPTIPTGTYTATATLTAFTNP